MRSASDEPARDASVIELRGEDGAPSTGPEARPRRPVVHAASHHEDGVEGPLEARVSIPHRALQPPQEPRPQRFTARERQHEHYAPDEHAATSTPRHDQATTPPPVPVTSRNGRTSVSVLRPAPGPRSCTSAADAP